MYTEFYQESQFFFLGAMEKILSMHAHMRGEERRRPVPLPLLPGFSCSSGALLAYKNSFSVLFTAGDVSRGGKSATQRQKFHTQSDDLNQYLHNKSSSHGDPNTNLFNSTFW